MNLYFDNASTSFPKPAAVANAVSDYINNCGGTYSRAAYGRVANGTSMVERCRDLLAAKIGSTMAEHLFFTMNATQSANTLLKGIGIKKCRVLVSPLEHNAVMRPLQFLAEDNGVKIELLPADSCGRVDVEKLTAVDQNNVSLIVVNHQSNVNGVVQPIEAISEWAGDIPIMIDATQSIGYQSIEADNWNIDYLFFSAHKGLLAPSGVGGFWAKNPDTIATYNHGGTGSNSESFEMPKVYPDRFEAGTPNMAGLAGTVAALENAPTTKHSFSDFCNLVMSLQQIEDIKVHTSNSPFDYTTQGEVISLTHSRLTPSILSALLYDSYQCETRSGLHCSPLAHRTLNTYPSGTLRLSLSPYHTHQDIDYLQNTIHELCKKS